MVRVTEIDTVRPPSLTGRILVVKDLAVSFHEKRARRIARLIQTIRATTAHLCSHRAGMIGDDEAERALYNINAELHGVGTVDDFSRWFHFRKSHQVYSSRRMRYVRLANGFFVSTVSVRTVRSAQQRSTTEAVLRRAEQRKAEFDKSRCTLEFADCELTSILSHYQTWLLGKGVNAAKDHWWDDFDLFELADSKGAEIVADMAIGMITPIVERMLQDAHEFLALHDIEVPVSIDGWTLERIRQVRSEVSRRLHPDQYRGDGSGDEIFIQARMYIESIEQLVRRYLASHGRGESNVVGN